jgi:hypothetical protein
MHRHFTATFLALIAVGLVLAAPATAEDEAALREEVRQLREKVDAMQGQQAALLATEVEKYLDSSADLRSVQGDNPLSGVKITSRFTAVNQNTLGLDPANRSVFNGDVDLDFDFAVTDNLDLFVHLTANDGSSEEFSDLEFGFYGSNGAFPSQFGSVSVGFPPESFGPIAGNTFGGFADGIGVNGTVPTDPGSITVYEAGIYHRMQVGSRTLHWELGALDPRRRFLQNAFADDENTQFINNDFDDTPVFLWLTDASGRTVYGLHMWMNFGDNNQFTVNWGWFNTPGQWFNRGQFYAQIAWKGEVNGREMNLRGAVCIDEFFRNAADDGSAAGGASWDWWVTDKVGLFIRIGANGDDVNPVEFHASVGVQFNGLIGSRPDDVIGVAVGFLNANDKTLVVLPEDTEFTLEVYYKYMMEDGKLQITPHLIYVSDPGGNLSPWQDDSLFIIGVRVHVPF